MKTYSIADWQEFDALLDQIKGEYGTYQHRDHQSINQILFRGQTNGEWPLSTTLERVSQRTWTIQSYCQAVLGCATEITSFTEKDWKLPKHEELVTELENTFDPRFPHLPFYEYFVYLRHHGFPSPLLDWTASPYIAAFFALADRSNSDNCCVYAYIESPQGLKTITGGKPKITVQGPNVTTHKRHFLQKAWYTIATCANRETKAHEFVRHDLAFDSDQDTGVVQDVLLKIEIPTANRMRMLDHLDDYNINYFSLFQSEEALMKAIARKEFEG